jgi:carbamoyl-phosphate synthase large subunit
MKTLMVTGASGIVGYGILKSLRQGGKQYKLIGTTIYPDSAAQGFCDVFEQAIPTNSPGYIEWLIGVIKKHKVDLLFSGIDADMYFFNANRRAIEETGVKIVLNKPYLINICEDKYIFYLSLKRSKYAIPSYNEDDFDFICDNLGLPFLLKPVNGFGSKGIIKVTCYDDYYSRRQYIGNGLMVQQIVGTDDEEYTVSAFCDGVGGYWASMCLKRKLSKDGYTDRAEVVQVNEEMHEALKEICGIFMPFGCTNFQFRKHEGTLKLLEINPRISSSTSIRAAFGYNESLMAVEYFLEDKVPEQPEITNGKAVRYTEDMIFHE